MAVMPDFQEQELENRRRYAELLRQQGMQPLEQRMAGRVAIRNSPVEGLAKMLQAYSGQRELQDVSADRKALADRRNEMTAAALRGMPMPQQQPTVGEGMTGGLDAQDYPRGAAPGDTRTVQPSMQDYGSWMARLAQAGPQAVGIGNALLGMQQRQAETAEQRAARRQESEAARAARRQELELRLQDARTSAQDRANLQRELAAMNNQARQDMVRLAAQMRPAPQPQAPQIIQTDTGIFERRPDGTVAPIVDPTSGRPLQPKQTGNAKGKTDVEATMDVYTQASEGLIRGLTGTDTGPIAGRLPAFTTGQQVAEGSVAAMAPVLKQMFRVAGEGTFTDKDQELLLKMVPTRTDTPKAAQEKIENIDNIVSAKLGIPPPPRPWRGQTQPITNPRRRASDAEPPPGAVRRLQ